MNHVCRPNECFDVSVEEGPRTGRWFARCPKCAVVLDGLTGGLAENAIIEHMNQKHFLMLREDWGKLVGNA